MWSGLDPLANSTGTFAVIDLTFSFGSLGGFQGWSEVCELVRAKALQLAEEGGGVLVEHRSSTREFVFFFGRPSRAVEAMVEVQRWFLTSSDDETTLPQIRIAIHTGEVSAVPNEGTSTLEQSFGIKDLAYEHQILVSLSTQELVRANLDSSIAFRDLGTHRVQSYSRAEKLFQVTAPGLPAEFPNLRSLDSALTNVEPASNSFVGRDRELFELAVKIRSSRIVTLCGPHGVGKSRLANHLARSLLHEYADGVFVIDFAETVEPSFVAETMAAELPFVETVGVDLLPHLAEQLGSRQMLLVLDNCDMVRQELLDITSHVFSKLRSVEVLFTCREPMGAPTEHSYTLGPLSSDAAASEAVELLTQRTAEVVPGFRLSEEAMPTARDMCAALKGIPLLIELVTLKLKSIPMEVLREQIIEVTKDAVGARPQDVHKFVHLVLSWLLEPLSDIQRRVLCRASVFSGGWESDAVCVLVDDELSAPAVLETVELLVLMGLVRRLRVGGQVARFRLSGSLRQLGAIRCCEEGEYDQFRQKQLLWCVALANQSATELVGRNQQSFVERLDREKLNLRSAIEWALQRERFEDAYAIVQGVQMFWYKRGYITEGRVWLERLLATSANEGSDHRARALNSLGVFHMASGDNSKAHKYLDKARDMGTDLELAALVASALTNLGIIARGDNDLTRAAEMFRQAAELHRRSDEEHKYATALGNLGAALSEGGQFEEADKILKQSLAISSKIGNEWSVVMLNYNLASLSLRRNEMEKAEPLLSQSLSNWFKMRDFRSVAMTLNSMAQMAQKLGQSERAAVLLGASASFRERLHQELPPIERDELKATVSSLTGQLGECRFFRKWDEGNSFSPDAAVGYALGARNEIASS